MASEKSNNERLMDVALALIRTEILGIFEVYCDDIESGKNELLADSIGFVRGVCNLVNNLKENNNNES